MLSSEYIHEKVLDTTSCNIEDVGKLAELMALFPYVSSFPILYLKALANSQDVRLDSEIEKYAYRISSRIVLFDLLNPRFEAEVIPEKLLTVHIGVENTITETEVKENSPIIHREIIEEIVTANPETIEIEEEIVPKIQQVNAEEIETTNSETIKIEEKIDLETQVVNAEEIKTSDSEINLEVEEEIVAKIEEDISEEFKKENAQLEQLIQSSAISSSFMESNFIEEEKETNLELEIEKILDSEIVKEKKIEPNFKDGKTEIEPKSARSFSSWLSLGGTTLPIIKKEKELVDEVEIYEESKKIEYYNFEKPKKEFYSPIKKAKESLSESNMPVSETLAKIFALQGNYPKAIYVYEQLILIFPEKKSFFALQIKNLKKKINS